MEAAKQWHILYTRKGQEQKVCDGLRRRKMAGFYPVNKTAKTSYGRERVITTPIIERYVFAHISLEQADDIKNLNGVIGFVHWLSEPVIIDGDDIHLLTRFCEMHGDIRLENTKVLSLTPAYTSVQYSDEITELLYLHVPVLGYNMIAKENRTHVKVITINEYGVKPEAGSNQYAETR